MENRDMTISQVSAVIILQSSSSSWSSSSSSSRLSLSPSSSLLLSSSSTSNHDDQGVDKILAWLNRRDMSRAFWTPATSTHATISASVIHNIRTTHKFRQKRSRNTRKGSKSAFWPHATISLSQPVWSIIRSWRFLLLSGFSGWAWYRKGFVHVFFFLRVSIIISQQSGGELDGWKAEILSLNFGNSWLTGEAVSLILLFHHRHHLNHNTHLYHRHCVHVFLARWCDWLGPLSTFRTCRREEMSIAYCLLAAFTYHQDIVWLSTSFSESSSLTSKLSRL